MQIFSKYFHHHFHLKILCKIFDAVLRLVLNSSPQFYSHPACRLLELQLTFCKFSCCIGLCSTHTYIFFKSETAQLTNCKHFSLKYLFSNKMGAVVGIWLKKNCGRGPGSCRMLLARRRRRQRRVLQK